MASKDFTPRQLLHRAIGKEAEAKMMYEIYAEKVQDEQGKNLLKELALEEAGHQQILEKIDPDRPGTFKSKKISTGEFQEFSAKTEITKESTMQEVLRYAIGEELDAFTFYDSLAEYAAEKTLQNLLHRLASEERKHKERLERLYDEMFQPEN